MTNFKSVLKAGYLYLVSAISIIMIIIAATSVVQNIITYNILDIKQERWGETPEAICNWKYVPKVESESADFVSVPNTYNYDSLEECLETESKSIEHRAKIQYAYDMAQALAMLLVAIPVWIYHWKLIRREEQ